MIHCLKTYRDDSSPTNGWIQSEAKKKKKKPESVTVIRSEYCKTDHVTICLHLLAEVNLFAKLLVLRRRLWPGLELNRWFHTGARVESFKWEKLIGYHFHFHINESSYRGVHLSEFPDSSNFVELIFWTVSSLEEKAWYMHEIIN